MANGCQYLAYRLVTVLDGVTCQTATCLCCSRLLEGCEGSENLQHAKNRSLSQLLVYKYWTSIASF